MAFLPLHSSLLVLRLIWLKIKPSDFMAWGEFLWRCSVGTCPQHWQLVLQETLAGLTAALGCLYLLPSVPIGECCYGWGELRKETVVRTAQAKTHSPRLEYSWNCFWDCGFIRITELLLWTHFFPIAQRQRVPKRTWKGNSSGITPGLRWGKTGWFLCTRMTTVLHEIWVVSAGMFES